jgi:hypothetical protein
MGLDEGNFGACPLPNSDHPEGWGATKGAGLLGVVSEAKDRLLEQK